MSTLCTEPGVRESLGCRQVATPAAVTGGAHIDAQGFVAP